MKRILPLFCLLLNISCLFAQTSVTVVAGLNESYFSQPNLNANTSTSNTNDTKSNQFNSGIQVGALLNINVGNVTIQPGLLYTTKGNNGTDSYNYVDASNNNYYDNTTVKETIGYIQLPVNILYNTPISKKFKLFLGGGPYIAYGIWGKSHESDAVGSNTSAGSSVSNYSYDNDLSFGNNPGNIKNPDVGLNAVAGIKLKNRFSFIANYGFGLTNLATPETAVYFTTLAPGTLASSAPTIANPNKFRNRTLNCSIGYSFY